MDHLALWMEVITFGKNSRRLLENLASLNLEESIVDNN
jgi:hypothetical protein